VEAEQSYNVEWVVAESSANGRVPVSIQGRVYIASPIEVSTMLRVAVG
jgi:hypothetical protein